MSDPKKPAAPLPPIDDKFVEDVVAAAAASTPAEEEGGILSKAEIEAIRAQARAEILADKKKTAKSQMLIAEKARLLHEEGLTTGVGSKDEMVNFTVDLAEYAASIVLNLRPYWHGRTYTVPRHLAETLREICQRSHEHQNDVDGKSRRHFYQQHRDTSISPVKGVKGAPISPGAEVR